MLEIDGLIGRSGLGPDEIERGGVSISLLSLVRKAPQRRTMGALAKVADLFSVWPSELGFSLQDMPQRPVRTPGRKVAIEGCIGKVMADLELDAERLCELSGLPDRSVELALEDVLQVTPRTLIAIAAGLGVAVCDLFCESEVMEAH